METYSKGINTIESVFHVEESAEVAPHDNEGDDSREIDLPIQMQGAEHAINEEITPELTEEEKMSIMQSENFLSFINTSSKLVIPRHIQTHRHTHRHTHTHVHTHSHPHSHSLMLSYTHSHTLVLTLTHCHAHPHSHTHSHSHTLTHTSTHIVSHTPSSTPKPPQPHTHNPTHPHSQRERVCVSV